MVVGQGFSVEVRLDRDSMKVRRASREVLGVSRKPCRQRGLEGQRLCEKYGTSGNSVGCGRVSKREPGGG